MCRDATFHAFCPNENKHSHNIFVYEFLSLRFEGVEYLKQIWFLWADIESDIWIELLSDSLIYLCLEIDFLVRLEKKSILETGMSFFFVLSVMFSFDFICTMVRRRLFSAFFILWLVTDTTCACTYKRIYIFKSNYFEWKTTRKRRVSAVIPIKLTVTDRKNRFQIIKPRLLRFILSIDMKRRNCSYVRDRR